MNESEKLDEIFGSKKYWTSSRGNKYEIFRCDLCECFSLKYPCCGNTTCNCGGCDKCKEDDKEFRECKTTEYAYLLIEEMEILEKVNLLKRHILDCLAAGFKEINWKWLEDNGKLCQLDYKFWGDKINE